MRTGFTIEAAVGWDGTPQTKFPSLWVGTAAYNLGGTLGFFAPTTIGTSSGSTLETTAAKTQVVLTKQVFITGLTIALSGQLTSGKSISIRFNVNGVTQPSPAINMTSGQQIASASGLLVVPAGSALCLEVTADNTNAVTLQSFSIGYWTADGGAILLRQMGAQNAATIKSIFGHLGQNFGPPENSPANSWYGRAFHMAKAQVHVDVAPGVGNIWGYRFVDGSGFIGTQLQITDGFTDVVGDVNVNIPVATDPSAAGAVAYNRTVTGTPAAINDFGICQEYQDALDSSVFYIGFGTGATNIGGAATDRFIGYMQSGGTTVESTVQGVVGAPCTIVSFFGRLVYGNANEAYELAIRVNGVDKYVTSLAIPGAGAAAFVNTSPSVALAVGDLVSIRYKNTANLSGTFVGWFVLGIQSTAVY